jgi:hypothetical protein
MPCKIEIRKAIDANIDTLTQNDYWGFREKDARNAAVKLNSNWGSIASVQQTSGQGGYRIIISRLDEAVDREFARQSVAEKKFERDLDFFKSDAALYEQEKNELREGDGPQISTQSSLFGLDKSNLDFHINTLSAVGKFLENIGIEQRLVPEFLAEDGSVVEGALAAANFVNGTVDILDDLNKRPAAWNKLPEEAAHWWYRLLDKNSELKEALLTSAATTRKESELRDSLYGDLYEGPKVISQLALDEDGNVTQLPALSAIREEAIGQLIAEAIQRIEQRNAAPEDYSFLKKFIEWINSIVDMFKSTEADPYDVAAMKILSSDLTDLMSWEEYNALNNSVYIDSVVSDQSVSPVDTSIIADLGRVEILTGFTDNLVRYPDGVAQRYRWVFGERLYETYIDDENEVANLDAGFNDAVNVAPSPAFDTREELDVWIFNNVPQYTLRQERSLQEVKDNEIFFDRLLNKTFKQRSRFLSKTLKKQYKILDSEGGLRSYGDFRPRLTNVEITKKLSPIEKEALIHTNNYTNITPTLKVLPDVLKKYSKNPISLSEPLKMDTAKKQELLVINAVMGMIKEENPTKKSISAEDLVNEVSNYLKVNYLLGFANEDQYLSYRIDQTFTEVPDRTTDEDVDMTNLNDETLAQMPMAERQRLIQLTGLTKQNPSVYHNKVSLRFNDKYFADRSTHFKLSPSAWGNLTYFYTGNNTFKDAVLLHEIQNDNIEFLREFKPNELNLDNQLLQFKNDLEETLVENLQQLRNGGLKVVKAKDGFISFSGRSEDPSFEGMVVSTSTRVSPVFNENYLYRFLKDNQVVGDTPSIQEIEILHERLLINLRERTDLYEGNRGAETLININNTLDRLYSGRRQYQDFFRKGGASSILSAEDIKNIEDVIAFAEGRFDNISEDIGYFKSDYRIKEIEEKINNYLNATYKNTYLKFKLDIAAKRGRTGLNPSIKYLLYNSEKKIMEEFNKSITDQKKQKLGALKAESVYNFQKNLLKITRNQFIQVINSINYNEELLKQAVDKQIEIDLLQKQTNSNENLDELLEQQEGFYKQALADADKSAKELSKKYKNPEEIAKETLNIEMNYFTPLVHHLLQKHIKEAGKETPMYFSGHDITLLTQGNKQTALIYAGKEEIPFTPEQVREIKKEAAQNLGLLRSVTNPTTEEVNKALSEFKKEGRFNASRITSEILQLTKGRPIETGALYNAMSQIPGIKLIWQPSIKGIKGGAGGYLVDLSNYNYNTPVLYGLEAKQPAAETSNKLPASPASPASVAIFKDFLKRAGVDIQTLKSIIVDGAKQDANGAALIMQKLVQVIEGKEDVALPEEAMHFAVEIIQQTDPKLFNQLLKEINGYAILDKVFKLYGNDPNYQTKDGKPDVIKLKKEAIGKVLAETIINKAEGRTEIPQNLAKVENWWQSIITSIKNLFAKSGMDQAAIKVMSGEAMGTAADIRAKEGEVYFQKNSQQQVYDKINEVRSKIEKRDDGYYINGKKIPTRVTELIKGWNKDLLDANELTKSEYKKLIDNEKALNGTKGHSDIEYAFGLFVDENGDLRADPLNDDGYISQLDPNNRKFYETLRDNLQIRLNSFPEGTKFMAEVIVYDPKRGVAGTIDFLAITPEGKVNILDWKFVDIDIKMNKGDLPWYYTSSWRKQMGQYKLILQDSYGINPKDFEQTRMIPIRAEYSNINNVTKELPRVLSVEIGDPDAQEITKNYLIPLGLETETTGSKEIDALLVKLNAEYSRLAEKGVPPSERLNKNEQLNILFTSIRQLQMRGDLGPLLTQAKVLNRQLTNLIDKYNTQFKGKDAKTFDEAEINRMSLEINRAEATISIYTTLDTDLDFLFENDSSEEAKQLEEDLTKTVKDARKLQVQLRKLSDDFNEDVVAASVDVKKLISPEKIIKGLGKWFGTTSTFQSKAIQVLYKKANKAFAYAGYDTLDETRRLGTYKANFDKWAKSKGLNPKNYFDILKKKDSNELIDQYNPDFYTTLKKKINDKDVDWIKNNIDIEAYKAALEEKIAEETARIEGKMAGRVGTDVQNLEAEADEISQMRRKYDISNPKGAGWFQYSLINKHPDTKWESAEWVELNKPQNRAAKDFYDYIIEKNNEYAELGYIYKGEARTFLPYVRKGLTEKLIFGGKITVGEQFIRSITVDEGDTGFGKFDPITGRPINTIPKYFTREIDGEVSTDLFRTMALYNEMAIKYKYVSEIEEQAQGLVATERNKKAIATSIFGKTQKDANGDLTYTPDNSENTKLLDDMVKSIIYGQKYITSESFDQILGKFGDFGEKINKKIGRDLFPKNLKGKQISFNKVINNINNQFAVNALGLNLLSSASNYFGGNSQSIINSGKYFTKADYLRNQLWVLPGKMIGGDKKKYIAALEYFLPLSENYNREVAKTLSLSNLTQERIQDFLMILMRKSDLNVQTTNFYSFLDNSIVLDGQVVNAREYLRSTPEYENMFTGTSDERKTRRDKFEEDVKQLVEEKGVMKLAELVDNKLVIPGVERKSESVVNLRRNVQSLTKNALGTLSDDDIRPINQTIYGSSFMLFKNWIPRLVDVRMGNLKYNSASDAYEWGRMRMMYRVISDDLLGSLKSLTSAIKGNDDQWVAQMQALFEKKAADYKADTGKDLEMTEGEFLGLVNQNMKSQMLDVIFLASMWALVMGLKAFAPDEDEDPAVRNKYKYLMRAVDKFKDEITYFYDPTSMAGLVSKGIFPSLAIIENFIKVIKNGGTELFYLYVEPDEKAVKKNFVLKYVMKQFPITSQAGAYLPAFYPEAAKDLGIKAQSQSGYAK